MEHRRYAFLAGPIEGELFSELLDALLSVGATAGLTSSGTFGPFKKRAKVHLLGSATTRRWPGVVIPRSGFRQRLFTYEYSPDFVRLLLEHCTDLYGFQDVGMPDNLHVLTQDGRVALGSITLDGAAWTELEESEWRAVALRSERVAAIPVEIRQTPEFDAIVAEREADSESSGRRRRRRP